MQGARHDHDTVLIADDHIARLDGDAAADDRQADPPGPVAHAGIRRHAAREDGKRGLDDARRVARHAVGDEGHDATVLRHHGEVVADHGRSGETVRRRDDHIAGRGERERAEDREIV